MSDVSTKTINLIYNEKAKRIDLDVLSRICDALNCQPGDLLEFNKKQ